MALFERFAKRGIINAALSTQRPFPHDRWQAGYDTTGGVACVRRPSGLPVVIVDCCGELTELPWLGRHPECHSGTLFV
jgi:hypothetical protein